MKLKKTSTAQTDHKKTNRDPGTKPASKASKTMLVPALLVLLCGIRSYAWIPLYTLPERLNEWHPADREHLRCPGEVTFPSDDCEKAEELTLQELHINHGEKLSINGYTCTGLILLTSTWTSFFGDVSVTLSKKYRTPTTSECFATYQKKHSEISSYDNQLIHPNAKTWWLSTVVEEKNAIIIHDDQKSLYDPYVDAVIGILFPGGKCSPELPFQECMTVHSETIWMPEDSIIKVCDITSVKKGHAYRINNTLCGVGDSNGYVRSLEGACRQRFCRRNGIKTKDGYWFSGLSLSNVTECSEGSSILYHTTSLDDEERATVSIMRHERSECLDALESYLDTGRMSRRQISKFRRRFPGPGLAFRIFNGSLETSLVIYKGYNSWEEIIKNNTCLYIGGKCYDDREGFFNGISKGTDGRIIIPDKVIDEELYDISLLLSVEVSIEHPVIRSLSDTISTNIDNFDPQPESSHSYLDLGLGKLGNSIITALMWIAGGFLVVILIIMVSKRCLIRIRSKGGKRGPRERNQTQDLAVVLTEKDKEPFNSKKTAVKNERIREEKTPKSSSWEEHKETNF